jgi:hypothetical protein
MLASVEKSSKNLVLEGLPKWPARGADSLRPGIFEEPFAQRFRRACACVHQLKIHNVDQ